MWVCPKCGKKNDESIYCECGATKAMSDAGNLKTKQPYVNTSSNIETSRLVYSDGTATDTSKRVSALRIRYKDAYLVANTVTSFGALLKILGIFGGCGIGFLGFLIGSSLAESASRSSFGGNSGGGVFFAFLVIFGLIGCFVAAIFWILGVLVSAQGQILKASLDSSVNNSPFLTNEERARIMSLPAI